MGVNFWGVDLNWVKVYQKCKYTPSNIKKYNVMINTIIDRVMFLVVHVFGNPYNAITENNKDHK